jgi:hypothetical protein
VHGVIANPAGSAWSFGGSILTFAFPMILFIVVAATLYVLYTKPEMVPGHRVRPSERPVSYTAVPGSPPVLGSGPGQAARTEGAAAAETNPGPAASAGPAAETSAGEAARTEEAE